MPLLHPTLFSVIEGFEATKQSFQDLLETFKLVKKIIYLGIHNAVALKYADCRLYVCKVHIFKMYQKEFNLQKSLDTNSSFANL